VSDAEAADAVPRQRTTGQAEAKPPSPQPLERQRAPRPLVPARTSIDQYSDRELRQIAEWVASDGLLRTDEELLREVFDALPFERLGSRIRERLEAVAKAVKRNTSS
jgi:hypothetical protein